MGSFAVPDRQDVWQIGQVIHNRYEVRGLLGKGGMGQVYRVYARIWQKDVAVKRPSPTIFAKAEGKEQFVREAETWVKLGFYPHTVWCGAVEMIAGIPCVFAEYMEGGSLADWITDEEHPLFRKESDAAQERILDVAIQMAWGLWHAHTQGLVHQDVKPANVLLTSLGLAKVTDFGLAQGRYLAGEKTSLGRAGASVAVPGVGLMTLAYASPEQIEGRPLTHRTDLWSWAVSVVDLFVGAINRGYGPAAAEALEGYLAAGPHDPSQPRMPHGVVTLLRQCFQLDPAARPTGMYEVATTLQGIFAETMGFPYPRKMPLPELEFADHWGNVAASLRTLGKLEEALSACKRALYLDPQDAFAWAANGSILHDLERYEEALEAYEQALRLNPQAVVAWTNKGIVLGHLERYEEALSAVGQALRLDPQAAVAWVHKGTILGSLRRYEEALAACDQALHLDPQQVSAWTTKGHILGILEQYEKVLDTCEQALRLDPHDARAWTNAGTALLELERYEEALAAFEQVLHLDPQQVSAWVNKGFVLRFLNRHEEALSAFERALHLDPNRAETWVNEGVVLYGLQRYEEAWRACEQALSLNPHLATAWFTKSLVLYDLKRYEEVLSAVGLALSLDPSLARAWFYKGNALLQLNRGEEALAAYEQALRLDPCDAQAWLAKGLVLRVRKRYEEAHIALKQVQHLDPTILAELKDAKLL